MLHTEIASLMNEKSRMFDWAQKIEAKMNLSAEDKEISQVVDAWAKKIGDTGSDSNNEISQYIIKTVSPEVYDVPDTLLDAMFDRGSIGEFDDEKINTTAKNTLVTYDAAKGGNVNKSYIDITPTTFTWKHKQVETEISYTDLRRNGFKTVANLTVFAKEALQNKMFFDIFNAVDTVLAGGDQLINVAGTVPTVAAMDELALYIIDRGENPFTVSLSKYAQAIAKMSGYATFMSENMKEEYNRYGLTKFYGGCLIGSISGAKKTGDDLQLLPDKRVFGIAGKIGYLDMKGDLRVYETPDNNKEKMNLKITGFEFGYSIHRPEKMAKIVLI